MRCCNLGLLLLHCLMEIFGFWVSVSCLFLIYAVVIVLDAVNVVGSGVAVTGAAAVVIVDDDTTVVDGVDAVGNDCDKTEHDHDSDMLVSLDLYDIASFASDIADMDCKADHWEQNLVVNESFLFFF